MRLSPAGFAVGAAAIWGAAIFVIGGVNAFVPDYGEPVLALVVSLYPGYDASGTLGDLLLGTGYALLDGLAAGFVFAVLYNAVVALTSPRSAADGEA
jgi:hypothetical protein